MDLSIETAEHRKHRLEGYKEYARNNRESIRIKRREYYIKNRLNARNCINCGKPICLDAMQCRPCSKLLEKNPMWKGDKVGYDSLHEWIKKRKLKPELCEECKLKPPYDLANISGEYKRDVADYQWLCRTCHMHKDGRYKNLRQFQDR